MPKVKMLFYSFSFNYLLSISENNNNLGILYIINSMKSIGHTFYSCSSIMEA